MERKARFLLHASQALSPLQQNQLLEEAGRAEAVLENPRLLKDIGVDHESFQHTVDNLEKQHLYEDLISKGVTFLLREDEDYPTALEHIDQPPHLLYLKGKMPSTHPISIAIIGTRHPTPYGIRLAREFGEQLGEAGFVILSGCARGIDAHAMTGAIDAGGRCIGVIGTGIDRVYPKENFELFDAIPNRGCLVSEFAPGAKPLKHHFPWRNRLISGWALGLVVVEATLKSGTAGTVRWALDQGKDVFALPGPVHSELSRGPHKMLREGAHLAEHPEDIISFFREELRNLQLEREPDLGQQDPSENELGLIGEARDVEELMEISGLIFPELMTKLQRAVLEGKAEKLPGNLYRLKT